MRQRSSHTLIARNQQPPYRIYDVDLSKEWLELVRQEKVAGTVPLPVDTIAENGDKSIATFVKYGVRMTPSCENSNDLTCQEFVVEEGLEAGEVSRHPIIRSINETLAKLQDPRHQNTPILEEATSSMSGVAFQKAGKFVAQLQLVRTLRPPSSAGFSGAMTSVPPPYDSSTDSFVTGPLRLELRPLVGRLTLEKGQSSSLITPWDVYHNVSPADVRGHFLLLPTISEPSNWRGQAFTTEDCHDIVHLADAIAPPGSLMIGYNSVGAGASQNHIHCHAWPSPPVPLLDEESPAMGGWDTYPVSKIQSIYDFCDVVKEDSSSVEVSYLEYPVFCVLLSAESSNLKLLEKSLATVLQCLDTAPHNIAFFNRIAKDDDKVDEESLGDSVSTKESRWVDVYVFARSKERSDILPTLKLGVSEMLGVFHAQSGKELERLCTIISREDLPIGEAHSHDHDHEDYAAGDVSLMEQALLDVNVEDELDLWENIKSKLNDLPDQSS